MSLITKYRPANWDEVIGNKALIASIVPLLKRGDSHAFLLTGPSGCGKTTIARLCAMELGAGEVIEIDAATNNGVDDARNLVDGTNYQPLRGGVRVIVIDECQAITAQAWRALLKSVEEPPNWLYWVFCTTEPNKVPSQIKTRCTIYEVESLPAYQIDTQLLAPVCQSERKNPEHKIVRLCADLAEGSPRKALSLLAQVIDCNSLEEAGEILRRGEDQNTPIWDFANSLVNRKDWSGICNHLRQLTDENPETIRRVVESYVTKVILNSSSPGVAKTLTPLLELFTTPIYGNNIAPIIVAASKWISKDEIVR